MRNRTGPQRPRNADENAMSRHVRQTSGIAGGSRIPAGQAVKNVVTKNGVQRPVLTEVTTTAVNRNKVRCLPDAALWIPFPLAPPPRFNVFEMTNRRRLLATRSE